MHYKNAPEVPTTEAYIQKIVLAQSCGKHQVPVGIACWDLETSAGMMLQGVCNRRAKKAGFIGRVSQSSLRSGKKK